MYWHTYVLHGRAECAEGHGCRRLRDQSCRTAGRAAPGYVAPAGHAAGVRGPRNCPMPERPYARPDFLAPGFSHFSALLRPLTSPPPPPTSGAHSTQYSQYLRYTEWATTPPPFSPPPASPSDLSHLPVLGHVPGLEFRGSCSPGYFPVLPARPLPAGPPSKQPTPSNPAGPSRPPPPAIPPAARPPRAPQAAAVRGRRRAAPTARRLGGAGGPPAPGSPGGSKRAGGSQVRPRGPGPAPIPKVAPRVTSGEAAAPRVSTAHAAPRVSTAVPRSRKGTCRSAYLLHRKWPGWRQARCARLTLERGRRFEVATRRRPRRESGRGRRTRRSASTTAAPRCGAGHALLTWRLRGRTARWWLGRGGAWSWTQPNRRVPPGVRRQASQPHAHGFF